ncbi:hypothetical protein MAR_001693 [Mya arenaria]|uniref:Uncharacterized protein n=1 Tax=Mya arenaria TaxID=6604 RepID=A0ABY7FCI7_MYAAR|nr:hypothetical protein MAR_001693 [Mya arenaria]
MEKIVHNGTINSYVDAEGNPLRFKMRDDFIRGKLKECLLHVCQKEEADSLDFEEEWHLETPLGCQMLMEGFINKKSLNKA